MVNVTGVSTLESTFRVPPTATQELIVEAADALKNEKLHTRVRRSTENPYQI